MSDTQVTQAKVPAGVIDLGIGQPYEELLPLEMISEAANHRFQYGNPDILQYGAQQGDGNFRISLAQFLSREYATAVSPDDLLVTAGVSEALDLICAVLTRAGDTIIVEDPTYFLALRIFEDHGLKVVGTPMDRHGLDIQALEENIRKYNPVFIYTIPVYQNPTGVTLKQERRAQLLALSEKHDVLIVADEVYQLLSYGEAPPVPLALSDRNAKVISMGSFSKILAPGLRLGWMQASMKQLKPFIDCGRLDSGGGLSPFVSSVVGSMIELGHQQAHLNRLRTVYKDRIDTCTRWLNEEIPLLEFEVPGGGYFYWARLADGMDAEALRAHAVGNKVNFQTGRKFSPRGGFSDHLRISFAYYPKNILKEGIKRLGKALQSFSTSFRTT